ncbi:MAG: formylglycine-generating enzyme family protein [Candidatus Sumerlaeota bacterium]|nr:formylglycine-generating enzyme family protein [Candidatus Sumerlaeota bacterium]
MDGLRVKHRVVAALCAACLWGIVQTGSAVEGPPTLGTVTDAGGSTAHLTWTNGSSPPVQFLGFAYDYYASNWAQGGAGGTMWYPFPASATSGNMALGSSGAYFVWISNQYGDGWYACGNPWAGILYSGTPHGPSGVVTTRQLGAKNVRLHWKPDLYGTWRYQIIVFKAGVGYIVTDGPGGVSEWHAVDYGGTAYSAGQASFSEGWADFTLGAGTYWFYIAAQGWQAPYPLSQFATAPATVLAEKNFNLPNGAILTMVKIPAGSFQMGSPDAERSRMTCEGPVHGVTIGYSFYLGKFLVKQKQWQAVMGSNPAHDHGVGDNYPVYSVSWDDCQAFITVLNGLGLGGTFRLPSESEGEDARRAGTTTRFFFGDSLSVDDHATDGPAGTLPGNRSDYMWYEFNATASNPVATKRPNPWGLYDMSGNVMEWCQDWYHTSYTGAPTNGSAWQTQQSGYPYRVCRGGRWSDAAAYCRSASRDYASPDSRYYGLGVRLSWTQ